MLYKNVNNNITSVANAIQMIEQKLVSINFKMTNYSKIYIQNILQIN